MTLPVHERQVVAEEEGDGHTVPVFRLLAQMRGWVRMRTSVDVRSCLLLQVAPSACGVTAAITQIVRC